MHSLILKLPCRRCGQRRKFIVRVFDYCLNNKAVFDHPYATFNDYVDLPAQAQDFAFPMHAVLAVFLQCFCWPSLCVRRLPKSINPYAYGGGLHYPYGRTFMKGFRVCSARKQSSPTYAHAHEHNHLHLLTHMSRYHLRMPVQPYTSMF